VSNTAEAEVQIDPPSDTKPIEAAAPTRKVGRKSVLALSVFALGLNATAAVYTWSPSDFTLPDVTRLAELLPLQKASDPVSDPVITALADIQVNQQQHIALLQDTSTTLQQNAALLHQDSSVLASLRQSVTDERADVKRISAEITDQHADVKKMSAQITDEHGDVKKMSAQISTLIAKVDALQSAIAPEMTSSIPKGRARARLSAAARKSMARMPKPPLGPVSIGGAPLTTAPAAAWSSVQGPEG
jgi:cell division protein FtsB